MLNVRLDRVQLWAFTGFALVSLISLLAGFAMRQYALLVVPFVLVFGFVALVDFKKIFYLLLFALPLSTEVTFGSFGTDLPTEPIMVALMFAFFVFILARPRQLPFKFVQHPIILLLLLHFLWMAFVILFSENQVVSFKFLLAKTWYIATFVFVAALILNRKVELKKFFWLIYIPMTLTIIQVLIRYAALGFAFDDVNLPMPPFYRNHVNYAAMITAFYPFIFLATTWYQPGTFKRRLLQLSKVLYLVAIYFSYTRACFLGLFLAGVAYVLMQRGLLTWAFRGVIVVILAAIIWLSRENHFLRLAPDYTKTVYHSNFNDHLVATYELTDVSSMERVYRWVAAFNMIPQRPWTGVGTGNFYPYYQSYTVVDFVTYTSDNEEKSTVHDYFLLTAVEQGIPGLLIFLLLSLALFHYGEKGYRAAKDPEKKRIILTIIMSFVIIYVNLSLNDLMEVDKTGSLTFMNMAMLVNLLIGNFDTSDKPKALV